MGPSRKQEKKNSKTAFTQKEEEEEEEEKWQQSSSNASKFSFTPRICNCLQWCCSTITTSGWFVGFVYLLQQHDTKREFFNPYNNIEEIP
jgi:hypothetical protein